MTHKGFSEYLARKFPTKAPVICEDCEKVFLGGPRSHFCPKCRQKRLSAAAKRRNLNKLGNVAYTKQQAEKRIGEKGK